MSARLYNAGDRLDRFEVVSVLGSGGSATVYRVRHVLLGSEYALKLVASPSGEDRERLLREGRAQSILRHRNIVPVLDAVSIGEDLGLVLELVEGPDLAAWLEGRVPDLETVDRLAGDLFDGLALAHAQGLIHRDLKPTNVLIADSEGQPTARIVDFGLAKDFTDMSPGLTQSTWIFGTPAYAAPEQAAGARSVDIRADVFSLGAMLYEIATGQRAFPGKNILDVMQAAADEQYVDPRKLRADIPPRMVATIRAALRADPANRAPDVATLRAIWSGAEVDALEAPLPPNRVQPQPLTPPTLAAVSAPSPATLAESRDPVSPTLAPWPAPVEPAALFDPEPTQRPRVPVAAWIVGASVIALVALVALWTVDTLPTVVEVTAPEPSMADAEARIANTATASPEITTPPEAAPAVAVSPARSVGSQGAVERPHRVMPDLTSAPASLAPPTRLDASAAQAPPATPLPPPEVRIEGDANEVVLLDVQGERVPEGTVDVGSYAVEARFHADEARVTALRLDLRPGEVATVTCYAGLRRCSMRKTAKH